MQTFLPYRSFERSAKVLDPSRLGNQLYREGIPLLKGMWANHPASRMWQSNMYALGEYLLACADQLSERGHHYPHHVKTVKALMRRYKKHGTEPPVWLGNRAFHRSHKRALIYKLPEHYQRLWPNLDPIGYTVKPNGERSLNYVWPVPIVRRTK